MMASREREKERDGFNESFPNERERKKMREDS